MPFSWLAFAMRLDPHFIDYHRLCGLIGIFFILDLIAFLPFFPVAFRYPGKASAGILPNFFEIGLGLLWLGSSVALIAGDATDRLLGLLVLFIIFRCYYVHDRWKNVRRGAGAPGFMSAWIVFYLLLLELSCWLDADGRLALGALNLMKFDFALIILCAGAYKMLTGYFSGAGMEYGQVNPLWSYHWKYLRRLNPGSPFFSFSNYTASLVELSAGLLMLVPVPWLQFTGALLVSLSFVYIGALIRLGRLACLMAVIPLFFWPYLPSSIIHASRPLARNLLPSWGISAGMIAIALLMVAMVLVKIMQYLNLFLNRQLFPLLQKALTFMADLWPIIIWRVFTPDVTNFFVRIYTISKSRQKTALIHESKTYNYSDWRQPLLKLRFLNVTESIAITSVFTVLKYFPSKTEVFRERLLSYAFSIQAAPCDNVQDLIFEYVAIRKKPGCFEFIPVGSFTVDLATCLITEDRYLEDFDFSQPAVYSPVRESVGYGTYVKKH